jgi:hypothetical protein
MLKFDSDEFPPLDRDGNLISSVTGAQQAGSTWLKRR